MNEMTYKINDNNVIIYIIIYVYDIFKQFIKKNYTCKQKGKQYFF